MGRKRPKAAAAAGAGAGAAAGTDMDAAAAAASVEILHSKRRVVRSHKHGGLAALDGGDAWDFLMESGMLEALRYHILHNVEYFTTRTRARGGGASSSAKAAAAADAAAAAAFSPAVTLLGGGAGTGKTRFLQELPRIFSEELMEVLEEGGALPFTDHMTLWCDVDCLDGSGASACVDEMVGARTLACVHPSFKKAKGPHSLARSIEAMREKMLIPSTVPRRRIAVLLCIDVFTTCRYTLPALQRAIQQYGDYVTKSDYFIFPVTTLTCTAEVVAALQQTASGEPWSLGVLPQLCPFMIPPTISGESALPVALPPGVFEAMKGHPVAIGYLYLVVQKDPTASPLAWLTRVKLLLLGRYRPVLPPNSGAAAGKKAAVEL